MNMRNVKIRYRLVIINILISLLFILVIGVFVFRLSLEFLRNESTDYLEEFTTEYGTKFDSKMIKRETVVKSLAIYIEHSFDMEKYKENNEYIREYKDSIVSTVFEMNMLSGNVYVYFNPDLDIITHDIWFYDSDENGIPERMPEVTKSFYDGDYIKKPWFYGVIDKKEGLWSKPFSSNIGLQDSYFTFSMPVYIEDKFIGVVGSDFVVDKLKRELMEEKIFDRGYFSIISDKGEFVIHPRYNFDVNINSLDLEEYKGIYKYIMSEEKEGIVTENNINIVSYYKLRNGWYMTGIVEKSDIFDSLFRFSLLVIMISIILIIISALFLYKFSRSITNPLELLTYKIQEIRKGNYDVDIPDKCKNDNGEIGHLSREIDNMKFKLRNSFEMIEKQNSELDSKVHERTRELTDANTYLWHTLHELEKTKEELIKIKKMKNINSMVLEISTGLKEPISHLYKEIEVVDKEIKSTKLILFNNKLTKSKFSEFITNIQTMVDRCFVKLKEVNSLLEDLKKREVSEESIEEEINRLDD